MAVTTKDKEKAETAGRTAALTRTLADLEKTFGKGAVMRLGERAHMRIEAVTSGILSLDVALGVGGYPRGRIVEVYGPESGGKTTVALHAIAEVQKAGGVAAFVDAEHALDPAYAKRLGVNIDELLISQPSTGEEALEITEALVRSGAVDIVVIDSVAALVPKAEIEGEMGDSHVGLQARLMSQALRKLTAVTGKSHAIVLFINQLREKIGISYGNPEVTTGGRALRFYSSIRIEVRRIETLKNNGVEVGNRVKAKVVKNKVAPPFQIGEFDLIFGEGVSQEGSILDMAVSADLVKKSGAWFSYKEMKLGQGRDAARVFLKENPDLAKDLLGQLRANVLVAVAPPEDLADLDDEADDLDDEG
jgi:recombination protein RecA